MLYYTQTFEEWRVYYNRINVSTYVHMYVYLPNHLKIVALFLGLDTSYLYQVVRNYIRNIIVSKRFVKIFNSF